MKVENGKRKVENEICRAERVSASLMNRFRNKFGMTRFATIFAVVLSLFTVFALGSCADENGLHDQNALMVTFEFTGFGEISGDYSIPGNFDGSGAWDNTNVDVVMKDGGGTSNKIAVTSSNIQFSLCPVNEWTRPWYQKGVLEGNGSDGGTMQNFYIDGLDLNAGEITLIIDASSGTAVPEVK